MVIVTHRWQLVVVEYTIVKDPPTFFLVKDFGLKCVDRNLFEVWTNGELTTAISAPKTEKNLKNYSEAWVYENVSDRESFGLCAWVVVHIREKADQSRDKPENDYEQTKKLVQFSELVVDLLVMLPRLSVVEAAQAS